MDSLRDTDFFRMRKKTIDRFRSESEVAMPDAPSLTILGGERHHRNLVNIFKSHVQALALPRINQDLPMLYDHSLLGTLRHLAMSAATVGHALISLIRYIRHCRYDIRLRLEHRPGQAVIYFEAAQSESSIKPQGMELWIATIALLIGDLRGFPLKPHALAFSHAPLGSTSNYDNYFNCAVLFAQGQNYLAIPADTLCQACVKHDANVHAMVRYCLEVQETPSDDISVEVERQIIILLPQQRCTLEQVALALDLHPRTLQRRMSQAAFDFEECLDRIRRRQAEQMLRKTSLTVGQISGELGYRRTTSFCRAHLRWFEMTPLEHRRQYGDSTIREI